jgi:GTP-binding protein HflX
VLVLNKIDLASGDRRDSLGRRFSDAVFVSAKTGEGLESLVERIERDLPSFPIDITILVPYGREELIGKLYRNGEVLKQETQDAGTLLHVRVEEREFNLVKEFVVPADYPVGMS